MIFNKIFDHFDGDLNLCIVHCDGRFQIIKKYY